MHIREATKEDYKGWLRVRKALWPKCSDEMHKVEMEEYLANPRTRTVFLIIDSNDQVNGFAEVSIRRRVDGSLSAQVGYLEGWYVEPTLRGKGLGGKLIKAAEKWISAHGLNELASDAELGNKESIEAHIAMGFRETFRLVHFIKNIKNET
jgi:aminoglycoside 6'-N-acetyltransferase I